MKKVYFFDLGRLGNYFRHDASENLGVNGRVATPNQIISCHLHKKGYTPLSC